MCRYVCQPVQSLTPVVDRHVPMRGTAPADPWAFNLDRGWRPRPPPNEPAMPPRRAG